jgi:hypothetical protein
MRGPLSEARGNPDGGIGEVRDPQGKVANPVPANRDAGGTSWTLAPGFRGLVTDYRLGEVDAPSFFSINSPFDPERGWVVPTSRSPTGELVDRELVDRELDAVSAQTYPHPLLACGGRSFRAGPGTFGERI